MPPAVPEPEKTPSLAGDTASRMLATNPLDLCTKTGFWQAFFERGTIIRALKVSAVVGSLLVTINQGDLIFSGHWPPVWKLLLTYMVPYSVSSYSAAAFKIALEREGTSPSH